ncbi:MAG: response regulator [Deltaproteobacteria bacterium]|nr:response regulator [Deltaproteobacteria bacterium]
MRLTSAQFEALQAMANAAEGKSTTTANEPAASGKGQQDRRKASESVRVSGETIERMRGLVGELIVGSLHRTEWLQELRGLHRRLGALAEGLRARGHESSEARELERDLFRLMGRLDRGMRDAALTADDLDETLLQASLAPLEPWLLSLRTVVRDAVRTAGIQARMDVEAADLSMERALLTSLREPMLHLLRNAVAHGIEPPEVRRDAGKDPVGVIAVTARALGDQVEMVVRDDGGGVNRAALARKLDCPVAELDDDERLLAALASDGVSTARSSTQLAGRGVGMGAVLDGIAGVGGRLTLRSRPGEGTQFTLRVPRRTTSGSGVVVVCGQTPLAVPIHDVERIVRLQEDDFVQVEQARCVEHGDALVSARSIAELIGDLDEPRADGRGRHTALLLRSAGARLIVLVDEVVGDLPLVIKPLGPQFEGVSLYAGCAVEPDGSPLPVLDVGELFRRARTSRFSAIEREVAADVETESDEGTPAPVHALRVLLVEDSMTMRTMERNILQGAGYEVITATDGREGWTRFAADPRIDLVVTDVEMPHMDGIELCRRIRQSDRGHTPVVIVTSLASASDRRRGAQAGADAYVTKGDFDERRFLGTIAKVVDAGA